MGNLGEFEEYLLTVGIINFTICLGLYLNISYFKVSQGKYKLCVCNLLNPGSKVVLLCLSKLPFKLNNIFFTNFIPITSI